jgi:hypothetical protein
MNTNNKAIGIHTSLINGKDYEHDQVMLIEDCVALIQENTTLKSIFTDSECISVYRQLLNKPTLQKGLIKLITALFDDQVEESFLTDCLKVYKYSDCLEPLTYVLHCGAIMLKQENFIKSFKLASKCYRSRKSSVDSVFIESALVLLNDTVCADIISYMTNTANFKAIVFY